MIELGQAKGDLSPETTSYLKGAAGMLYVGTVLICVTVFVADEVTQLPSSAGTDTVRSRMPRYSSVS